MAHNARTARMAVKLPKSIAAEVRAVVARFGPASAGTLNPTAVVCRAIVRGLPALAEELAAGARAVVATDDATHAEESRP